MWLTTVIFRIPCRVLYIILSLSTYLLLIQKFSKFHFIKNTLEIILIACYFGSLKRRIKYIILSLPLHCDEKMEHVFVKANCLLRAVKHTNEFPLSKSTRHGLFLLGECNQFFFFYKRWGFNFSISFNLLNKLQ